MVYNTLNYWDFGVYPSSYILKNRTRSFGNLICFLPHVRGKTPTQLGPLEIANGTMDKVQKPSNFMRAV
jgi:hypothetical protein